jgi:AcrR family transcriptional regulator
MAPAAEKAPETTVQHMRDPSASDDTRPGAGAGAGDATTGAGSLPAACRGRPRDERASAAIAAAALRQLEDLGYGRMSMESVAAEAGVARATVYRRFQDKADLVTSALASRLDPPTRAEGPLERLVVFLDQFDARIAEHCLEVIGCLLAAREEPQAMDLHRARVVHPRVRSTRTLLEEARDAGLLREDADLDLVLQMLVGAVFARRVAGLPHERGWARRAVAEACRGAATPEGLASLEPARAAARTGRRVTTAVAER